MDFIKSIKMVVGSSAVSPAPAQCHGSSPLLSSPSHEYKLSDIWRGGAQDVSHHTSINLNWIIQNTAKYLQIKMNIARPGARADLEHAERRQNSIILIRNSGLFFLSNLQTHFVFTQIYADIKYFVI